MTVPTTVPDITGILSNSRSQFHEVFVELRLRSFPVRPLLAISEGSTIRISKQNLEIEQLPAGVAVRLRVASCLLKSSRSCLRIQWFGSDEPNEVFMFEHGLGTLVLAMGGLSVGGTEVRSLKKPIGGGDAIQR